MLLKLNWKRKSSMDRYRKSAEEIMKRGDIIIAEKKRRSAIYKRTIFAVSGLCAAIIAGVGIWNSPQLRNLIGRTAPDNNGIIAENTEHPETHTETTATQKDVSIVTYAATSEKNTVASTTVSVIKKTEKKQNTQTAPVASNTAMRPTGTETRAANSVTTTATRTAPPVAQTTIAVETTVATVSTTSLNEDIPPNPVTTTEQNPSISPPSGSVTGADIDFLVNPHNLDEVTQITYNNIIYKNTYITDNYDTIAYNEHEYLGLVCHNEKIYGELFVIFDYIDNEYDLLIFIPWGSGKYYDFFPEEIL